MKNKGIWIGIGLGVAALGAAAFFILRKKKPKEKQKETTKSSEPPPLPVPLPPPPPRKSRGSVVIGEPTNYPTQATDSFLKKNFYRDLNAYGTKINTGSTKVADNFELRSGLKNNDAVRFLQTFLNIVAQEKIKAKQSYYKPRDGVNDFELKVNGDFDYDTEQALGWYTNKTTISKGNVMKAGTYMLLNKTIMPILIL